MSNRESTFQNERHSSNSVHKPFLNRVPFSRSGRVNSIRYFNIFKLIRYLPNRHYRVFSHDVTAAILVFQNNEMAAMLVSQTNPVGVELFSYANAFFCSNKFAYMLATWVKTLYIQDALLIYYIRLQNTTAGSFVSSWSDRRRTAEVKSNYTSIYVPRIWFIRESSAWFFRHCTQ